MPKQMPTWIKVSNVLKESQEYDKMQSYRSSNLSTENEKQRMRDLTKELERQLTENFEGADNASDLKESWGEVFQFAERYDNAKQYADEQREQETNYRKSVLS